MHDCETCKFYDSDKCTMCVSGSKYMAAQKKSYGLKKNYNKTTNRMGSKAEMINHESNTATISTSMTPNSGAGKVKGDEQIVGLVNIMQEVKTQETEALNTQEQEPAVEVKRELKSVAIF